MIIRKEVRKGSDKSGILHLPVEYTGKFVYVITDDDFDKTFNLLDESMIKLKIYNQRIIDFEKKLDEQYSMMNTRMTYIERIVQSMVAPKDIVDKSNEIKE
jgi:hypothetical protein